MTEPEQILDTSSLPGPDDVAVRRLDNGLTLLARENFITPAVYGAGYINAGAQDESNRQAGLASLVASMVTRGTAAYSYDDLNERIEGVGASLNVSASTHVTNFNIKSLSEDTGMLLDLLAEVLRRPNFPKQQFARVKSRRLTALRERAHNTQAMAAITFNEHVYPEGHPYHYPNSGYIETVEPLERDDLANFFEANYEPRGGAIAIVGALPAEEALDLLESTFGDWENVPERDRPTAPQVERPSSVVRVHSDVPGKSQSDIVLGVPSVRAYDEEYFAVILANSVLGMFGLMGRLGKSVRDEKGLAYYAYSMLQRTPDLSPWYVRAGVAPQNVEEAVETILAEISRMYTEIVPAEELVDNKSYLTGSLPLQLETNEGVASSLLNIVRYDLGLDYLKRYPQIIADLSAEDVQRVMAQYWKEAYVLAVAGP